MSKAILLPPEWLNTKLENITSDISYGYTAKSSVKKIGPCMLRITDIQNNQVTWNTVPFCEIDDIAKEKYKLFSGDLVFARTGATVGKSFLIKGNIPESVYASYLIRVRCMSETSVEYLSHFFRTPQYWQQITEFSSGIGQPNVNGTKLKGLDIPVPPLAEQKQIAAKLDELLAQVDTLKTRLDTIPTILKRFRQSVLAAAVSGKLTESWRQENSTKKSVTEIKEDIREYRFNFWVNSQMAKYKAKGKVPKNDNWKKKYSEPPKYSGQDRTELPEGWVYEPLDGLVYIAARIGWKGLKASEYTINGPLFLSVHSLNYGQYVNLDKAFHISNERYEESPEIKLANDDVLLCKDGAGIGKIAVVKGLDKSASINSSLLLVRAGKYFKTEYLYYFLAGPVMQKLVQERMTGTAVPHLFQRDVKEFILEVPPIEEQTEIIKCVEQLLKLAEQIEQRVKDAQSKVNYLTQSILAKAFRGELTEEWREQNLDLISNENSAEVLLERIKTEREKITPKQRMTRKKTR